MTTPSWKAALWSDFAAAALSSEMPSVASRTASGRADFAANCADQMIEEYEGRFGEIKDK